VANRRGKAVDSTSLSTHGFLELRGLIHRDYLAHVLRFAHVARFLGWNHRFRTAHVLDVGCGVEAPLAALMYHMNMTHTTGSYTGVDYGPIGKSYYLKQPREKFHALWYPNTDLVTWAPAADDPVRLRVPFDVIVMFEVAEHVEPLHTFRMLQSIRGLLADGGSAFISTPCYDPHVGPADNHVNEMTGGAFRALLGAAGLTVANCWGTFASQRDYKPLMTRYPGLEDIWNRLSAYYHPCVTACLFAPLFPDAARNCLWQLHPGVVTLPPDLPAWAAPENSSSAKWSTDVLTILDILGGVHGRE
jgi:SAM-dependent methyltransferase